MGCERKAPAVHSPHVGSSSIQFRRALELWTLKERRLFDLDFTGQTSEKTKCAGTWRKSHLFDVDLTVLICRKKNKKY